MTPLICFYKGNYILSKDYQELEISSDNWKVCLEEIENNHHDQLKILKIDYDHISHLQLHRNKKESLYSSSPIGLILINEYEILTGAKLEAFLLNYKRKCPTQFEPLISRDEYNKAIETTLEGIRRGDIYQLNLTFPFKGESKSTPLENFAHYHREFHGSYHAFIPLKGESLICLSPELFLSKENERLTTRPIKGTSQADEKSIQELIASEKENAELSMIVDLLRNDLNTVADIASSQVVAHREIMNLGDLTHTYSQITASTSRSIIDILESTLPGGSISGCPKKKACEYIHQIEKYKRGFYTGILGWWHKDDFEFNILIRSFMQKDNGEIYYHAGGGIVIDSVPEKEYQEVLLKSKRIEQ